MSIASNDACIFQRIQWFIFKRQRLDFKRQDMKWQITELMISDIMLSMISSQILYGCKNSIKFNAKFKYDSCHYKK